MNLILNCFFKKNLGEKRETITFKDYATYILQRYNFGRNRSKHKILHKTQNIETQPNLPQLRMS